MNPVKELRKLESLTQDDFALKVGVSRHFIVRLEQGCYEDIPLSILSWFQGRGYASPWLVSAYHHWVAERRTRNFDKLAPEFLTYNPKDFMEYGRPVDNINPKFINEPHPFIQWRYFSGIFSQVKIATFYCVHPARLSSFENKSIEPNVPSQLREALLVSGYSERILDELQRRYSEYRDRKFNQDN